MTTKEMIAVMQAYEEGKQIQVRGKHNTIAEDDWKDIRFTPDWDWGLCDFRIKPEEKPVRMTNRQLNEWLAKGFGEWSYSGDYSVFCEYVYTKGKENTIDKDVFIRPWGSDEWIEPTVDIYNRDCKGE